MKDTLCNICPRHCNAARTAGQTGFCGQTDRLRIARAALHYWEEPCISGNKMQGSGAIFFAGCNLGCVFCQNAEISRGVGAGIEVSRGRLVEIMLDLQAKGAVNINLVTAGHFVPYITDALKRAKDSGLHIPIVYNSGGYELVETLKQLSGLVDIYLPDMKYAMPRIAERYARARDYPEIAMAAIAEMYRQTGPAVVRDDGLLLRGVLVRHLMLPGHLQDSKRIVKYLYETYGDGIIISLMSQYTPMAHMLAYPELNRRVSHREYRELVDYALGLGVSNAYIQEGDCGERSFVPAFDGSGVV